MPTTVLPSSTPAGFLQERARGHGSDRSGFTSTPTACLISLTVGFLETRRTHEISLTVDEARSVKLSALVWHLGRPQARAGLAVDLPSILSTPPQPSFPFQLLSIAWIDPYLCVYSCMQLHVS